MPIALEKSYQGTLLSKILLMPKQKPISFHEAVDIVCEKADVAFSQRRFGNEPGAYTWYVNNFVEYIASLGHHIELTGDEFDFAATL